MQPVTFKEMNLLCHFLSPLDSVDNNLAGALGHIFSSKLMFKLFYNPPSLALKSSNGGLEKHEQSSSFSQLLSIFLWFVFFDFGAIFHFLSHTSLL